MYLIHTSGFKMVGNCMAHSVKAESMYMYVLGHSVPRETHEIHEMNQIPIIIAMEQ